MMSCHCHLCDSRDSHVMWLNQLNHWTWHCHVWLSGDMITVVRYISTDKWHPRTVGASSSAWLDATDSACHLFGLKGSSMVSWVSLSKRFGLTTYKAQTQARACEDLFPAHFTSTIFGSFAAAGWQRWILRLHQNKWPTWMLFIMFFTANKAKPENINLGWLGSWPDIVDG